MKDFDKEIKEHEKKIEELKKEKVRVELTPKNILLAEELHSKLCRWNHTDGCGWFYENWEKPGTERQRYLDKANDMLEETTFDDAIKVLKFM